jgi:hypothetical protein
MYLGLFSSRVYHEQHTSWAEGRRFKAPKSGLTVCNKPQRPDECGISAGGYCCEAGPTANKCKSNEDEYETTSCFALDNTVIIINIFIVCTTCKSFKQC